MSVGIVLVSEAHVFVLLLNTAVKAAVEGCSLLFAIILHCLRWLALCMQR
jgi:hypothetical protein